MNLGSFIKSADAEDRDKALELCNLILKSSPEAAQFNVVAHALEARDLTLKASLSKIWQALYETHSTNQKGFAAFKKFNSEGISKQVDALIGIAED